MWSDLCVEVNEYKGGVRKDVNGLLMKFNFNFRVNNSDIFFSLVNLPHTIPVIKS